MTTTKIEWTDETWNVIRGCSKVSDGCRNCYAMHVAARFSGAGQPYEGIAKRSPARWVGHASLIASKLHEPLHWRRPRRVFVNSMSDLFHESLTNEQIAAVFGVMAACPQHTFQVLTKRPKRMREWFEWLAFRGSQMWCRQDPEHHPDPCFCMGQTYTQTGGPYDMTAVSVPMPASLTWPLPNLWLGVSIENQETANERIPLLLDTPAAVRFISAEPLLGPLDLTEVDDGEDALDPECWGDCACPPDPGCRKQGGDGELHRRLDWVIVGGESGPSARPCNVDWVRSVVRQCREARTPVFVKQMGAVPTTVSVNGWPNRDPFCWWWGVDDDGLRATYRPKDRKGGNPDEWPEELRVREYPRVWQEASHGQSI